MVNHPPHYTAHPVYSGECFDYTRHMDFVTGNGFKYIWRFDQKNGAEDVRKAVWYLTRIERPAVVPPTIVERMDDELRTYRTAIEREVLNLDNTVARGGRPRARVIAEHPKYATLAAAEALFMLASGEPVVAWRRVTSDLLTAPVETSTTPTTPTYPPGARPARSLQPGLSRRGRDVAAHAAEDGKTTTGPAD